jgi:apolipoprotein N-acyltransferase
MNEKGEIVSRTQQFQAEVLRGGIQVFSGRTPFSVWGSWPVLLVCIGILLLVRLCPNVLLESFNRLRNRQTAAVKRPAERHRS